LDEYLRQFRDGYRTGAVDKEKEREGRVGLIE